MEELDLNEWFTVLTNGEWWCGRRKVAQTNGSSEGRKLESLQKLVFQFGMLETPQGIRPHVVALTYPWFGMETMVIPEGALWNTVLSYKDVPWAQILGSTEKLKLEQRAQRSGLHLASH